jgi:hypothetical protein
VAVRGDEREDGGRKREERMDIKREVKRINCVQDLDA